MIIRDLTTGLAKLLNLPGNKTSQLIRAAILAGGMLNAGSAGAETLFFEDFEGLPLGPFVSASEREGDGTDWTNIGPSGWTFDNTTTPVGGPVEYFGFTFFDIDSWVATTGNQDRNSFTKGGVGAHGTVMLADPDEYDDFFEIDPRLFNVFAQTPSIDLTSVVPGSVTVNFDSSFRPYESMIGLVDVSLDGGLSWTNLLTLDLASTPGGMNSLVRANESLSLPVPNLPSDSLLVRFGMEDAGNDWWWAVDNVRITGEVVPEPSGCTLLSTAVPILIGRAIRRKSKTKRDARGLPR